MSYPFKGKYRFEVMQHVRVQLCVFANVHKEHHVFIFSVIQDMTILSGYSEFTNVMFMLTILSSFYNYSNNKNIAHTPSISFGLKRQYSDRGL